MKESPLTIFLLVLFVSLMLTMMPIVHASNITWRLYYDPSHELLPGEPVIVDDVIVLPVFDPTERFASILFIDPDNLSIKNIIGYRPPWYPRFAETIVYDNLVFIHDKEGFVHVVDPASMSLLGVYEPVNNSIDMRLLLSDLVLGDDGYFYAATWGTKYYPISAIVKLSWNGNGFNIVWSVVNADYPWPGKIVYHNSKIYVASLERVYVLDAETGELLKSVNLGFEKPYAPINVTAYWDNGLVVLLTVGNKSSLDIAYQRTIVLYFDDNLNLLSEKMLYWRDTGKPAHFCYYGPQYSTMISGGWTPSCPDTGRIIDYTNKQVLYFKKDFYLKDYDVEVDVNDAVVGGGSGDSILVATSIGLDHLLGQILLLKLPVDFTKIDNVSMIGRLSILYQIYDVDTKVVLLSPVLDSLVVVDDIVFTRVSAGEPVLPSMRALDTLDVEETSTPLHNTSTTSISLTSSVTSTACTTQTTRSTTQTTALSNATATTQGVTHNATSATQNTETPNIIIPITITTIIVVVAILFMLRRRTL